MDTIAYFMAVVIAIVVTVGIVIASVRTREMARENEDLWNLVHDIEERN